MKEVLFLKKNMLALLVCIICLSMVPSFVYADGEEYTITFDTGEYGAVAPVTIIPSNQDNTVSKPANPEGNDHCLEYWTKEGSSEPYDFSSEVTSSFTLVAHWSDEHSYSDVEIITPATCTETGSKNVICTKCGARDTQVIPKKDHTISSEPVEAIAATCTEDGTLEYYTCETCDTKFADSNGSSVLTSVLDPRKGHAMTEHAEVAATCTEDGNKHYWSCSRCNKNFKDAEGSEEESNIIIPASHHMTEHEEEPGTCVTEGTKHYWSCDRCNKNYKDENGEEEETDITIPAGHNMTAHEAVAATCLVPGNKQYWSCDRCKKNYKDQNGDEEETDIVEPAKRPELGHVWDAAGRCSECGTLAFTLDISVSGPGKVRVNGIETTANRSIFLNPREDTTVELIPDTGMFFNWLTVNNREDEPQNNSIIVSGNFGEQCSIAVSFSNHARNAMAMVTKVPSTATDTAAKKIQAALADEYGITTAEIPYSIVNVTPVWSDGAGNPTSTVLSAADISATNGIPFTLSAPSGLTSASHVFYVYHFNGTTYDYLQMGLDILTKDFSDFATFAVPKRSLTITPTKADLDNVTSIPRINNGNTQTGGLEKLMTGMQYKHAGEEDTKYREVEKTTVRDLAPGTYIVRIKGTSYERQITIIDMYTVSFERLRGKGTYEVTDAAKYDGAENTYLVEKGKQISVKWKPDNHYWLFEVYVNGEYVHAKNVKIEMSFKDIHDKTKITYGFSDSSSSPKTGDNNDVTLWVTEEIVSLLGMTAITWYLFRRKET